MFFSFPQDAGERLMEDAFDSKWPAQLILEFR